MNVSVILAHPVAGSFNHAIAATAVEVLRHNGHSVCLHDLYAEKFDPVLLGPEIVSDAMVCDSVQAHCVEIASAEGIVIVHPNWWGQPPAIMTGWIDRVIRPGVAYRFAEGDSGEGVPVGLLKAKKVVVFNTSNTPPQREQRDFGDPLELIWKRCVFGLCGVGDVRRETFGVVVTSSPEQREEWLDRARAVIAESFR
jgi:NAD(P)H dehydrogenase (quinone)